MSSLGVFSHWSLALDSLQRLALRRATMTPQDWEVVDGSSHNIAVSATLEMFELDPFTHQSQNITRSVFNERVCALSTLLWYKFVSYTCGQGFSRVGPFPLLALVKVAAASLSRR
jgi:hypothetical protein